MKFIYLSTFLLILGAIFSCHKDPSVVGCTDTTATNYNISATSSCSNCCVYPPKQGGVLFYIADPNAIPRCGNFVVTMSTGQQTTITGFYPVTPPASCVNTFGGYLLLNVGTYQYTVTSSGCAQGTGTITVVEGCNKVVI
jgi:hypothetical protein